jgi:hypothetical protein
VHLADAQRLAAELVGEPLPHLVPRDAGVDHLPDGLVGGVAVGTSAHVPTQFARGWAPVSPSAEAKPDSTSAALVSTASRRDLRDATRPGVLSRGAMAITRAAPAG